MHKKYTKLSHKDHQHHHHSSSTSKRHHVKYRNDQNESLLEIGNAPQNSVNELSKKLDYGDYKFKENAKHNRETHIKHRKTEDLRSNEHGRGKHSDKLIYNIADVGLIENEPVNRKDKKEKRDKERLNKIEKYLEGLNKVRNKNVTKNRSRSLESSESYCRNQKRHFRREKTFHDTRKTSTYSCLNISDERIKKISTNDKVKKSGKQRKHKESKERESSKEKSSRDKKEVLYCQVELESPFLREKKHYKLENIYPESSNKNNKTISRKRSSTRDRCSPIPTKLDSTSKVKLHRDKIKQSKEKKTHPIKFSHRKSKLKTDLRNYKDQRSNASLDPYGKLSLDKVQMEKRQKKRKRQKVDSQSKIPRNDKRSESIENKIKLNKRNQEKNPNSEQIEDDIKSYFSKIQNLIDRKLDFLLGNSNSKESKTSSIENEIDKIKHKREKKEETIAGKRPRERSHSKKDREHERHKSVEDMKKQKHLREESSDKRYQQVKTTRESRRDKVVHKSSTNLKREKYPSEDSQKHIRYQSPQQRQYKEYPAAHYLVDKEANNEEIRHLKRPKSPYHECTDQKIKPDRLINMVEHPSKYSVQSNASLLPEKQIEEAKHRPKEPHPPSAKEYHHKRDKSATRRTPMPDEDDFKVDPAQLQKAYAKKMKKRMRQLMNLECKTVSIVGIPSQIRESAIFNETQTTTSLNALNQIEEFLERKKQSKRFKLYYKYSVADNKCQHDSDKSSDGKKSIVSDSYRVVSDPSDNNLDVWEEDDKKPKGVNKESDAELAQIMFMMKKEKLDNCGDMSDNHGVVEHVSRKHRKRGSSPKATRLNNIVEEPSNVSIIIRRNESSLSLTKDIDCTFFNVLKSSSSDCNLQLIKKCAKNGFEVPSKKHKNRIPDKHIVDSRQKSPSGRGHEKDRQREPREKGDKRSKCDDEYQRLHKKIRKATSHHKIKKKRVINSNKYNSKSDINISYDSLTKYKCNKRKPKISDYSHFREQLKYILPDIPARKTSPDRRDLGLILKEELREIIRELPRNEAGLIDLADEKRTIKSKNKSAEDGVKDSREIEHKEASEKQKTEEKEEKKFCSKKIGTHQPTTKIPSLIKGYVATATSQIHKEHDPEEKEKVDNLTENVLKEPSEKALVDVATEMKIDTSDQTEIILEDKKSQTPRKAGAENAVYDSVKQSKHFKKSNTAGNTRRCQIIDPFTESKVSCVSKTTRPIINLENNHFPNRKHQDSDRSCRPMSAQYTRQKSSISEDQTDENYQGEKVPKKEKERPVTAEAKLKSTPKTPEPSKKRTTKPALTISTNVVTISTTSYVEKFTETPGTEINKNKNKYIRAKSTCSQKSKKPEELCSKSSLSLNYSTKESGVGNLVYTDKNSNIQNINSITNCMSLDRNSKSINTTHTSRLLLTKSFNPPVSTYHRRKMYDESIRKKMKKKVEIQNQIGPRVFEVRYLTLENENNTCNEHSKNTRVVNQKYVSKLPTFNTKNSKAKTKSKAYRASIKKSKKFLVNKEDACKYSGRDIFAPLTTDVDQLNKIRKKTFPEKTVEQIFINNETNDTQSESQSCSETIKEKIVNEDHPLGSNQTNTAEQNFKELIDSLYSSITAYCNSKFKIPQEECSKRSENKKVKPSQKMVSKESSNTIPPPISEKSYVIFRPPLEKEASKKATQPPLPLVPLKKNSSSISTICNKEKQSRYSNNVVCCHLSCPVLAGSASSFEYLYEDGAIEISKDAILSHFKKPTKTILGYTFNTHQARRSYLGFPKRADQISNSTTESEESGYSSTNSKKCASASSFFKRPSIANLFKPVKKIEDSFQSTSSLTECKYGPNLQQYDVMNQKCIEYAEKVRMQTQNKNEPEEIYQEIPLDVLLLCKKSSTLLDDFNSKCSLCNKYSNQHLPDITEGDEMSNSTRNLDQLEVKNSLTHADLSETIGNSKGLSQEEVQSETLIFYKDIDHRPSLEIITFQKSQNSLPVDDTAELTKEMLQNPVVLSSTNLNTHSLTIVEEEIKNNNSCSENVKYVESGVFHVNSDHVIQTNVNEYSNSSRTDLKSVAQSDIDGRSDMSSTCGFRTSTSLACKHMAKKFFENLLQVYEKEIDVTNKLYQDDDFFIKVLLESVKSEDNPKPKSLKKVIKGKIKNYFDNVFSKHYSQSEDTVFKATCNPSNNVQQRKLQILARNARRYFSMLVQAVKTNKDINDEVKICGLLKLLERIEDGDFAVLRGQEEVDFEDEIKGQIKDAFLNIYQVSVHEAKKRKRCLTTDDLKLIRTFVTKYRIGLLSKTDLIATYIGRGAFKTEGHLKAAVTYLIQQNKNKDVDLRDFDQQILTKCSR